MHFKLGQVHAAGAISRTLASLLDTNDTSAFVMVDLARIHTAQMLSAEAVLYVGGQGSGLSGIISSNDQEVSSDFVMMQMM